MRIVRQAIQVLAALSLLPVGAAAHIGNPDIYFEGAAGSYQLSVTVRPPVVIPGVAEIEVRSHDAHVRSIEVVPVPLTGEGSKYAPVPDRLKVSEQDPQFFTGSLWIMEAGSWQVRISAEGAAGPAKLAVPVPAVPVTTKKMEWELGTVLGAFMLLLVAGVVLISGASVREASLEPGERPGDAQEKRAQRFMAVTLVIVVAVLGLGGWWWRAEETSYRQNIFRPLRMQADLSPAGLLRLSLATPETAETDREARLEQAFFTRTVDDLIPDHDHLMHLYAIREPGLDIVYHLHPKLSGPGLFQLQLPSMEPGQYKLYADIVHANGFPETLVANIGVPRNLPGPALAGDDAQGEAKPWETADVSSNQFRLPDGYTMKWDRPDGVLLAKKPQDFRFTLLDSRGQPPSDMQLYMGMLGHAAFVKTDGSAFAHIHPSGTVSMASLMMAQQQLPDKSSDMDMPGMDHSAMAHDGVPNNVSFPYGFPSPGRYRIIVQMKHGENVETGIFDASVQ